MSENTINIFLPAAGLGERLRPITNHLPKPLLPMPDKPLIEIILGRLAPACKSSIGINLHWKPELIRAWAAASPWAGRITFFPEDPILGTGGALKNAEAFLANNPFIVHNADILLDIDFEKLIQTHVQNGNIATLATHRLPKLSNVVVDDNGLLLDVENPGASRPDPNTVANKVAYTGIAVYSPEILKFLPSGVSHATTAWIDAAKAGHRVQAFDVTGAYWSDIGTPATYAGTLLDTLRMNGETVYCSPSASCGTFETDGCIVIGDRSVIHDKARLRNCIVMPGSDVTGTHENRILGPGYAIDLTEAEMQPSLHASEQKQISLSNPLFAQFFIHNSALHTPPAPGAHECSRECRAHSALNILAFLIGLGGSDRRYYRVRHENTSAVLMECRQDDPDYERHLIYTRFFLAHNVPVPRLLAEDESTKRALFEDLGDTSLYAYLRLPHSANEIESAYQRVLDVAATLHGRTTEHVRECAALDARIFDYDYLRWETGYFLEQFVKGLRGVVPYDPAALAEEFHQLALQTDNFPKSVIHRDFQSQNIMMGSNGSVRVIDFQGARKAPAAYDIASMLWDPYYRLDEAMRERLLGYYVEIMNGFPTVFNKQVFYESLIPCRLQRHMQALGAYGFLSKGKGKKYFEKHIPEALRMLKDETTLARKEYPELCKLVSRLT